MNLVDQLICELDTGLRILFAKAHANRPLPTNPTTCWATLAARSMQLSGQSRSV